jgi:PIN domain nuclease of toxin-antitoxin system
VIVLDTHVWVWWVHDDPQLRREQREAILNAESDEIGVSIMSCWEIAKLVEYNRLTLPHPIREWMKKALDYPGVTLLELTPDIVVGSTSLPGQFHRDPADQLIVATALIYRAPLVTSDDKICSYPYVETIG